MRVVSYRRVSTTEQGQSGLGLEAQQAQIRDYIDHHSWELVEDFEDVQSGKSLNRRPGLDAALTVLDTGQADALIVAKLDRLSRSLLDFTHMLEQSQKRCWKLVALDLNMDTSTPVGEMVAHVILSMAQFERRLISERTKGALAVKKAQGARLGRPRTAPQELVEQVLSLLQEEGTLRKVADRLNAENVPTLRGGAQWYASTVRGLLQGAGDHGGEA